MVKSSIIEVPEIQRRQNSNSLFRAVLNLREVDSREQRFLADKVFLKNRLYTACPVQYHQLS